MHVRTDRYGRTRIHDDITHAPSLHTRVSAELAKRGIASTTLQARAVEIVKDNPTLTAAQAVAFVASRINA